MWWVYKHVYKVHNTMNHAVTTYRMNVSIREMISYVVLLSNRRHSG